MPLLQSVPSGFKSPMRKLLLPVCLPVLFLLSCGEEKETVPHVCYSWDVSATSFDFAKYVDPMIGTGGHGHTFPGATAPFGMVQLSPDTRVDGSWDGCSGYHYDDSLIYGFSHTHLSGTGCSDYGDILLMPGTGEINFNNGADGKPGYRSAFSHSNEKAEAGYYSVLLDNSGTKAELTVSPRVGVHRYTFPQGKEGWLLLDLTHRDEVIDSHLELVNDHTIRGYRFSKAWADDQRLWFYAEFSEPFESIPQENSNSDSASGKLVKWAFKFKSGKPVTVKLALSPVSCENAKLNMQTEVPDFDFDAVRKKVVQQWNTELGKIEVKNGSESEKKIFYTALYHCFIAPNLYCDVNGDYRGRDKQVHRDTLHPQYSVFSLWDTYRALHPLFTIIQPKRDQDFICTFLKQYKEGGRLPVWELSASETDCMIGYHSIPVIVDAWMKGLTDFDTAFAYEAMKASAMSDARGLKAYKQFGFIPAEGESESVSKTLEYAYDDWCIALAAKRMKKEDDYNYFMRRAQSWKNLYDPETGFMRARLNNSFVEPFDPNEVNFHYTEANAWQYSLAVQQDIPGLIAAHGGDEKFIQFLDKLFSASSKTSGRDQADISGLIGQYAQGNEPSHHMAYLYDYTSQPWKTQELVTRICEEQYKEGPAGLCGNEDCGQMSAWYVMSMLGLYDVSPGTEQFCFGSPRFGTVVLHLENKHDFIIQASLPLTASTTYPTPSYTCVKTIELNGKPVSQRSISFSQLAKGGTLLALLADDSKTAGSFDLPEKSSFTDQAIPPVPVVKRAYDLHKPEAKASASRTFTTSMKIELGSSGRDDEIFVSVNNAPFQIYRGNLQIDTTATLRACAKNAAGIYSDTVSFSYYKIPGGRSIKLLTDYKNQYAAGGNEALIDGIRGSHNFRTGTWQGYEGNNLEAVVDLGSEKEISKVSIGFLQDQGAWIFMPEEVMFYISNDGKNFTEYGSEKDPVDPKADGPQLHDFSSIKNAKARYIKIVAKNRGTCPEWHPGKGSPCWIFADEITIDTK